MSPRRPRRRARRRSPARPVILLVAAAIVLALVIGGLTQVSRQSQGYDANSNRSLAAQGTVLAEQSNATSSQVRTLLNGLSGQTRQGLQAGLDGAVQQTSAAGGAGEPRGDLQPAGLGGRPVRRRLRRAGPVHDRPAGRRLRVPRHAAQGRRRLAGRRVRSQRPDRAHVRDRGHEPHCRCGCTAVPLGRAVAFGPEVARLDARSRQPSRLGLGDEPAALAGGCGGGPARSRRHVAHLGADAQRGPAHGAAEPPGTAHAARRAVERVGPQPDRADRGDGGRGQRGNARRAERCRSVSLWRISHRARPRPASRRRTWSSAPRRLCRR